MNHCAYFFKNVRLMFSSREKQSRILEVVGKWRENEIWVILQRTSVFANSIHSFVIPAQKGTVKTLGEAEVMIEGKLLDSMGLLIQSSVPVLTTSDLFTAFPSFPHALFLGFLPFSEAIWFLLINTDPVSCF